MTNIKYSFLVTAIAGFSTLLGIIPIFLKSKSKDKIINSALSFSSGVMISISLFSLLPESVNLLSSRYSNERTILTILFFIVIGILISIIIDKIFKNTNNKLYKLGLINMVALMLHNIPEGILTFSTTTANKSLGTMIAISIICHNIPEGISISIPIYYATNSKAKAILYTLISGMSEILGAIITYLFLYKYINTYFISIILSIVIGIMIYIPIYELLPNAFNYNKKKITILFFITGFIFMLFFK